MIKPENALYRSEQIRACEQQARSLYQWDENELMSRAGEAAFVFLTKLYPHVRCIAVFCGSGNNAGDGYVLARLAHEHGFLVTIYQCTPLANLPSTAHQAALRAIAAGISCKPSGLAIDANIELIVDALLGIGLKGPVHGAIAAAINDINLMQLPVISLDIPSGLNADTGKVENLCIRAKTTITFIALKAGLYTDDGPDYCGDIYCCSLDLDIAALKQKPIASLLHADNLGLPRTPRKKNSHKGDFGHVLIIGSGLGMPGAVCLAAKAAMRTGAGAVSIATCPEHVKGVLSLIPEAMVWGIHSVNDLQPLLAKATVCVVGPGLGEDEWARSLFFVAMSTELPLIIDASALRLLAEEPQMKDHWVLTPHPGEAAALLSCTTAHIQEDRYQAVTNIQKKYGGVIVLKGAGSIIKSSEKIAFVCHKGNPAMASAGMGDVLSGIIAGLYAQGLSLSNAAQVGVYAHALAGDKIAQSIGGAGLLASDLLDVLPYILNYRE